ncbi:Clavaminate synthase-like protein [Hortaea werneckii]|uniref:Fe2OG dioxygenase domain-containing protein n=1 Tax=Hortaea werneckii TaxID=91943 RepID=A0A3M7GEG1_HORWE|nr:Clavaminate synthase-like protein [Hortaea werneckii]KAI7545751.1 Clavaminate synthase-like protein [Hortaea werneckii]KAI7594931.1 Clavaminate synthase-like protein [Hortaea werneckii]KAI7600922.1 Clavaminate synthase-like protein [Hortaea werneckii]KAI7653455.1 Clavaminate synthase-like protein [Hortaea werneckii]
MSSNKSETVEIPVIDLSPSNPHASSELLNAAAHYGFVFIANDPSTTGLSTAEIDTIFTLSKQFFSSPTQIKEEVSIASNQAGKNVGWLSQGIEKLDPTTQKRPDIKEAFNMGEPVNNQLQQPLPHPLKPHAQTLISFQNKCHALCQTILTHFATALEIERDWFTTRHDQTKGPSGTVFRLLYYPGPTVGSETEDDIRAGAHSDFGSLTLLFQQRGQPGLEIRTPEGEWAAVPVDPSARSPPSHGISGGNQDVEGSRQTGKTGTGALPILVNIGDLLEDWTAGLLKSTVHRVIFPKQRRKEDRRTVGGVEGEDGAEGEGGDRYSIAYFCHPLDEAELESVPSRRVEEFAAAGGGKDGGSRRSVVKGDGRVLTARDHLMERLGATYTVK